MQFAFQSTAPTILCCMCGTAIEPNPSNMCVNCIRSQVDITEGIPKQLVLNFCRYCGRYHQPPNYWVNCELESRELLTLCVKRIRGLNKVKLIDAGFIWTEPHSRRIKIKLTIQKEVFNSTILQQAFIVEYVLQSMQCTECQTSFTDNTWKAVVQLRQKTEHKRTFFYLEQLILKHSAHLQTIKIADQPDGLDFFFSHRTHASKFVDFLQSCVPIRYKTSEKLISHDTHTNQYNYNYSFSVEISPVCREDLVSLPKVFLSSFNNLASPFTLCTKISNQIFILDPTTLQTCEIPAANYWANPFKAAASSRQLIEYVIIDITPLGPTKGKYVLSECIVAREKDFGRNEKQFYTRTHLGALLGVGDVALGYDIESLNWEGETGKKGGKSQQGKGGVEVVLVKKKFGVAKGERLWKVKTLEKETIGDARGRRAGKDEKDFAQFQRELEEDEEYRQGLLLYKVDGADEIAKRKKNNNPGEEVKEIGLNELIDDFDDLGVEDDEEGMDEDGMDEDG
eukprot:TRINITY_DN3805_c0_g1_i1.p1 TRINITY_DN3805_c0_g1~~TRINITY_DN3805_c0_g1_i1.p1  ORF type:complete len:510 (-),score=120.12 TRINITY_DN3805_c0_g1_i1:25-1554(-)